MKRTLLVLLLVNLILSACAPASAPTPTSTPAPSATPLPTATATPTPTSTATPTSTPTATPTATPTSIPTIQVGGLSVPDPRITNPELFDLRNSNAPIPQFVNAMQKEGINIAPQIIIDELGKNYEIRQGADGRNYILTTYTVEDQNGTRYSMGFIAGQDNEKNWRWKSLDISKAFELNGKEVSIRAEAGWGNSTLRRAVEEGLRYFNDWFITNTTEEVTYHPENPEILNPHGLYYADLFINKSPSNGRIIGGHLLWTYSGPPNKPTLPSYLINATPEDLVKYTHKHVELVMRYFYDNHPSKKYDWTVAAEITSGNLFRTKNVPLNLNRPEKSYLIQAYRIADNIIKKYNRQRGPSGDRLAYSDFITSLNDHHIPQIIDILKALKQEGLIDAFHLQIRYGPNLNPNRPLTAEELSGLINRIYGETGVPVMITELGFENAAQPSVTQGFIHAARACRNNPNCLGIQFDKVLPENPNENELFSFENGHARPDIDYYAVLSAMIGL